MFQQRITTQLFVKHLPFIILGGFCFLSLFSPDVYAMKKDSMETGLTKLEGYLTGNIARGIVIGGCSIAAYRAYVDSKFGILGAAVAGALGLNFLMDFVNATYACLIQEATMERGRHYLLNHLDKPVRIFFFTVDELLIAIGPLFLGIFFGWAKTGLLTSLLGYFGLQQLKKNFAGSSFLEANYWYLPTSSKSWRLPVPSYIREYVS